MDRVEIKPQPGPQTTMLSTPADIAIYGGAAGGGKTWSLLIEPLRHLANSKFGAVIFRRSYSEITKEGGMWDESMGIYRQFGGIPVKGSLNWQFRSGARISFGHLQYDETLEDWKGAQIAMLGFDQLETFSEKQFFYMLSRNRSLCGIRPYVRATCNPLPGWLASFLDWWIDEDGYARLDRSGKMRWMVRINEQIHWADTKEKLHTEYGGDVLPLSVTFIAATIYDNKVLLDANPGYLANLRALPLVDRERLLGDSKRGGNWRIKPSAGNVFKRTWFKVVQAIPAGGVVVRFWDFAATERELASSDPDFTATCLMHRSDNGVYTILEATAELLGPAETDRAFVNRSRQDAERCKAENRRYMVRWEREPASAGKRESWRMTTMLAGIDALGVPSLGDKLVRAKPMAAQAETGNVAIMAGGWNERWLEHMHGQPDWPHDDEMDAASGGFNSLANESAGVQRGPSIW